MADKPIDFNPHSHKGSDKECVELGSNLTISIHTPTRGVTDNGKQEGIYMQFQSTLPQGEWRLHGSLHQFFWNFNPHSHKGSDRIDLLRHLSHLFHFNPHSHKGSDQRGCCCRYFDNISIHTPTRGVTQFLNRTRKRQINFNPHSHKGSDLGVKCQDNLMYISIHTPTRGVTSWNRRTSLRTTISLHTPTRGVTIRCQQIVRWLYISIHTPTRGVTGARTGDGGENPDFNPHSHKGSDQYDYLWWRNGKISIHTPTRGVTKRCSCRGDEVHNFNPHSHKGSDNRSECVAVVFWISIHTPTRGVTKSTM